MGRNPKRAKRVFDNRLSFNELCRKVGINPKQKIIMRRYMIERLKKGGEIKYGIKR